MFEIQKRKTGATSANGRIIGTYVHGVFGKDGFRRAFLNTIREGVASEVNYEATVEKTLEAFADHLEHAIDIDQVLKIAHTR